MFERRENQKLLYKACRKILDETGLDWDELYTAALGKHLHRSPDYEANFRSGRIAADKAELIYCWIVACHPKRADEICEQIIPSDAPDFVSNA